MKKHQFHWTFLSLLLIFVPPFFLVFTEEGNRISDNVILWLMGRQQITINLKEADGQFSQAQFKTAFPDIEWQCGSLQSRFGDTGCNANIGTFNEIPAHRILAYFNHGHLNAIQIDYRSEYHDTVIKHLRDMLGKPQDTNEANDLLEWRAEKGVALLKKSIQQGDQAALMWIAK